MPSAAAMGVRMAVAMLLVSLSAANKAIPTFAVSLRVRTTFRFLLMKVSF